MAEYRVQNFTQFARDFFLYSTYFPLDLNERASFKPKVFMQHTKTAVFEMSSFFSPYMRNYIFEKSRDAVLKTDEDLLRFLAPKCLKIFTQNLHPEPENFTLVVSLIHEFLLYLQMNRLCYRFHFTAYKCLVVVFQRLYFNPWRPMEGWMEEFQEYVLDNLLNMRPNASEKTTIEEASANKNDFQTKMVELFRNFKDEEFVPRERLLMAEGDPRDLLKDPDEVDDVPRDLVKDPDEVDYDLRDLVEDLDKIDDPQNLLNDQDKVDDDPRGLVNGPDEIEDDPFIIDLMPHQDLVEQKARGFEKFEQGIAISQLLPVPPYSKPPIDSPTDLSSENSEKGSSDVGDLSPPSGEVSPPGGDVSPPGGDVSPPGGDVSPPSGGYSPPSGNVSPPSGGYSPPSGNVSPPSGGYSPPGGDVSPPSSDHMSSSSSDSAVSKESVPIEFDLDTYDEEYEKKFETRTCFSKFEIYTSVMMKEAENRYGSVKFREKLLQRKCEYCGIKCYQFSYNLFKMQLGLAKVSKIAK